MDVSSLNPRWFLIGACIAITVLGCAPQSPLEPAEPPSAVTVFEEVPNMPHDAGRTTLFPAPGESVRVGGDMVAQVTGRDGNFRSGSCRVDTPLPVGYPLPTPPGAIDLKAYPSIRIAEVAGQGNPDRGMNKAFWPLFNHIKKHQIAMTSPVEMTYVDLDSERSGNPSSWSMAFVYRTPELNRPGTEGAVRVRDTEPLTVVAVGLKGDYGMKLVDRGMRVIEAWLSSNSDWEAAGPWRTLYYNGPTLFFWNKWSEVQLPVRRVKSASTTSELRSST